MEQNCPPYCLGKLSPFIIICKVAANASMAASYRKNDYDGYKHLRDSYQSMLGKLLEGLAKAMLE